MAFTSVLLLHVRLSPKNLDFSLDILLELLYTSSIKTVHLFYAVIPSIPKQNVPITPADNLQKCILAEK